MEGFSPWVFRLGHFSGWTAGSSLQVYVGLGMAFFFTGFEHLRRYAHHTIYCLAEGGKHMRCTYRIDR
jgi:hypothetical protein